MELFRMYNRVPRPTRSATQVALADFAGARLAAVSLKMDRGRASPVPGGGTQVRCGDGIDHRPPSDLGHYVE